MKPGSTLKVFLNTFGCKTNQYDSALMSQSLERSGFELTGELGEADWVVVNTCAVTRRGEEKAGQWVRMVGRERPGAKIAVVGCSVEVSAERFSALPGVSLLLGTEEKMNLGEALADTADSTGNGPRAFRGAVRQAGRYVETPVFQAPQDRARAFVKIQDGCDNRCTYCIVPYARGSSRSRPPEQVLEEVKALEAQSHLEVVLTGIHIGGYGGDLPGKPGLAGLVEKILAGTGRLRIRLSSIDAGEIEERLCALLTAELRLCRHLHLPLQHGSAGVLKRMGRPYTPEQYREVVDRLSAIIPGLGLGTDVIVGFPGESEEEFERCHDFIAELPFTYLHVFPFSPRPGTPASGMAGRPAGEKVRERVRRLRELSEHKKEQFLRAALGKELHVLHESRLASGVSVCRADNYVRVYHGQVSPESRFSLVAEKLWRDGLWGSLPGLA